EKLINQEVAAINKRSKEEEDAELKRIDRQREIFERELEGIRQQRDAKIEAAQTANEGDFTSFDVDQATFSINEETGREL
ncbi:hypothetical protein GWN26_08450, partial [Candidatus Saccharibacteria bacterium]|nr:hypothetical protein [Candidatus Saccharibacteria bacterium]NIW79456.1 hypothetical protein [Calditrichia bacterium]